jgi:photosystem II stability/assembly factor-like uncharacterized protein
MTPRVLLAIALVALLSPAAYGGSWLQTDWSGGPGQLGWADPSKYYDGQFVDGYRHSGNLTLEAPEDIFWEATAALPGAASVHALLVDGATIYAGGDIAGGYAVLFVTTDRGTSWDTTSSLPGGTAVRALAMQGSSLYVGCEGYDCVAVSSNNGETWAASAVLTGVTGIHALLCASDNSVYAGCTDGLDGLVFRSTDGGTSWATPDTLAFASSVFALMQAGTGYVYAGTGENGDVFRTTNSGVTWFNTGEMTGVTGVECLYEDVDNRQYAGTRPGAQVYRTTDGGGLWMPVTQFGSTGNVTSALVSDLGYVYLVGTFDVPIIVKTSDHGATWDTAAALVGVSDIWSIVEDPEGILYAGTAPNGEVYRSGYHTDGYLVSSVFDANGDSFGVISWSDSLSNQTLTVKIRTDTLPDMSTAAAWGSCPPAVNGGDISNLPSVVDGQRYMQYRLELSTGDRSISPALKWISTTYFKDIRDMGALRIVRPAQFILPKVLLNPKARFKNYGDVTDQFWALCRIDTITGATVYRDSISVSSLSPGDSTEVQFRPWLPGWHGAMYKVCIFTRLIGDEIAWNDTLCDNSTSFIMTTKISSHYADAPPVIDGIIDTLEWSQATALDASNVYGWQMSSKAVPWSARLQVLNDSAYLYLALAAVADSVLDVSDVLLVTVDDDNDSLWAADSSEGVYRGEHNSAASDTLLFVSMPSGFTTAVIGGQVGIDTTTGYVSYEVAVPLGSLKWQLDAQPGDSVGLFLRSLDQGSGDYVSWWPQTLADTSLQTPARFGLLILGVKVGEAEARSIRVSGNSLILEVHPNPLINSGEVSLNLGSRDQKGRESAARLCAFDLSGRLVKTFDLSAAAAGKGSSTINWDCRDNSGNELPSGIYFLKLMSGDSEATRKAVLLR